MMQTGIQNYIPKRIPLGKDSWPAFMVGCSLLYFVYISQLFLNFLQLSPRHTPLVHKLFPVECVSYLIKLLYLCENMRQTIHFEANPSIDKIALAISQSVLSAAFPSLLLKIMVSASP